MIVLCVIGAVHGENDMVSFYKCLDISDYMTIDMCIVLGKIYCVWIW